MYIYKDRNKGNVIERYYKYQENDFTQPILGENGILGGDFFAVEASSEYSSRKAYMSFDGKEDTKWGVNNVSERTGWLIFYNPSPLKVKTINYTSSTDYPTEDGGNITIYGSNNNDVWEELYVGDYQGATGVTKDWYVNSQDYYKYHKIEITDGIHNYMGLGNLMISAKQKFEIEVDKDDDYDHKKQEFIKNSGWANVQREKKYFKYRQEEFVQPELTENGMLGGSTFAVFASSEYSGSYQAYMAFDTSTSSEWAARGVPSDLNYIIYNPDPLYITEIEVTNRTDEENITSYRIEGAGRDKNWVALSDVVTNDKTSAYDKWKIVVGTPDYYNYYKISILTAVGNVGITNLKITGKTRNPIETSETDYDYSVDVPTVKLINKIGYRKG